MSIAQTSHLSDELLHVKQLEWLENETFWIIFGIAHIPLGILMGLSSTIATIHGLATILFGIYIAASKRSPLILLQVIAYIVSMEVLWRATRANLIWEAGKYLLILLLYIYLFREKEGQRISIFPLAFLALLLTSVPTVVLSNNFKDSRDILSYNLSGPLALAVGLVVFPHVKIPKDKLPSIYLALMTPVFALAARVLYNILTSSRVVFMDGSNELFSANYGANQISAILGFGALIGYLYINTTRSKGPHRWIILGATTWFMIHTVLTFSRGGVFSAMAGMAVASFFLLIDNSTRSRASVIIILVVAGVIYVAIPKLESLTGGLISTRFQDSDLTGRDSLIKGDILAWQSSPIFGVGPGGSRLFHGLTYSTESQPHTEYTRVLAEHGVFGLASYALLFIILAINLLQKRSGLEQALLYSLVVWGLLFLAVNGFRLVAPAFALSVSAISIVPSRSNNPN